MSKTDIFSGKGNSILSESTFVDFCNNLKESIKLFGTDFVNELNEIIKDTNLRPVKFYEVFGESFDAVSCSKTKLILDNIEQLKSCLENSEKVKDGKESNINNDKSVESSNGNSVDVGNQQELNELLEGITNSISQIDMAICNCLNEQNNVESLAELKGELLARINEFENLIQSFITCYSNGNEELIFSENQREQ